MQKFACEVRRQLDMTGRPWRTILWMQNNFTGHYWTLSLDPYVRASDIRAGFRQLKLTAKQENK